MSSILDQVAAEAVQSAINLVAKKMVAEGAGYKASDYLTEALKERIKAIMQEPEINAKLRAKLIELIDGLPNSMEVKRGY